MMVLALALPLTCQESGGKVKVVVENASIRLKPSLDSEAIEENIPVGTVYASNKKTGEWYEIKFESKLGVALLGYIHEMYVEFVGEAAPPSRKSNSLKSGSPKSDSRSGLPSRKSRAWEIRRWRSFWAGAWGSGLSLARPQPTPIAGRWASSTAMKKGRSSTR